MIKVPLGMPDRRMFELCCQISVEREPHKLLPLVEELAKLLAEEQDVIKSKIRAGLSQGANTSD